MNGFFPPSLDGCPVYQQLPTNLKGLDLAKIRSEIKGTKEFSSLRDKTQLLPSYLFPNIKTSRLSHSLDVAISLKNISKQFFCAYISNMLEIVGLCHDIGHPPFGHMGENILDSHMKLYGGFESNAQTIRILNKYNLNALTPILMKHKEVIPQIRCLKSKLVKGIYYNDYHNFDNHCTTAIELLSKITSIVDEMCYMISDFVDIITQFSTAQYSIELEHHTISRGSKKIINYILSSPSSSTSAILNNLIRENLIQFNLLSPTLDNNIAEINRINHSFISKAGVFDKEYVFVKEKLSLVFSHYTKFHTPNNKDECIYRSICDYLSLNTEKHLINEWSNINNVVRQKECCAV